MKKNPIYIAIINTDITPHNESVKLVYKWYQQIEPRCDGKVVNTCKMDKETFFKTIKDLIGEHRTSCCMYICEHGKQEQKEDNTVEEYLKLNKKNAISDVEFTQFINELPILQKYIMMEVCHSGGLLNEVKCDTNQNIPINTMVLSLCSKDEKMLLSYYLQRRCSIHILLLQYFLCACRSQSTQGTIESNGNP